MLIHTVSEGKIKKRRKDWNHVTIDMAWYVGVIIGTPESISISADTSHTHVLISYNVIDMHALVFKTWLEANIKIMVQWEIFGLGLNITLILGLVIWFENSMSL